MRPAAKSRPRSMSKLAWRSARHRSSGDAVSSAWATSSPRANASIPPMWAVNRSSGSVDSRRILAPKFSPPGAGPPCRVGTSIAPTVSYRSVGNWSVSRPFCGLPRLASMLPSRPWSGATCRSCWKVCPDRVAWLASILSLKSRSSPCRCRKPATVALSKSYWCFIGSAGFGSIRKLPAKPMLRPQSRAAARTAPGLPARASSAY